MTNTQLGMNDVVQHSYNKNTHTRVQHHSYPAVGYFKQTHYNINPIKEISDSNE